MSSATPLPASRALDRVLRGQLNPEAGLQLIIGQSLGLNPNATYVDVIVAGQQYTIPRLRTSTSIPVGAAVYILVDQRFNIMLAIGYTS